MLHKFKATVFLLAMLCLVVFKHPVIGYCPCDNSFFLGDSTHQIVHQHSESDSHHTTHHHHHDDHSCEPEQPHQHEHSDGDDHHLKLTLDPGDFLWQQSSLEHAPSAHLIAPPTFSHLVAHTHLTSLRDSRPLLRPPPDLHASTQPLFITFATLRI